MRTTKGLSGAREWKGRLGYRLEWRIAKIKNGGYPWRWHWTVAVGLSDPRAEVRRLYEVLDSRAKECQR